MRSGPRQREHRTGEHVMTQWTDLKYGPRRGKGLSERHHTSARTEERPQREVLRGAVGAPTPRIARC